MTAYQDLERLFERRALLSEARGMLHWDRATMMPAGAAEGRAEQIATLAVLTQDMLTEPRVADLLDAAEDAGGDLDDWQAANLREMRRAWRYATAVPSSLVAAIERAGGASEMVWREARPQNDFARQQPYLEEVLRLTREIAACRAEAFGCAPYDALLDEYEAGLTTATVGRVFDDLADFLPDFLDDVLVRQGAAATPLSPEGPFDIEAQRRLATDFMTALGFDFAHGRLDVSAHPFTGGVPDDVRITTRYTADDFTSALMGVLHETGHALYERGLPAAWRRQPVGGSGGMLLHESQSLLIEMQVCRGNAFLDYALPLMAAAFGGTGPAWRQDNILRLYQRVERGLIRVDADEVTYPLHIILRYRLERALLSGDLPIADLPAAWNDGMAELVGIRPPDDRDGCLQDIHWMDGAIGYFPTYTLGAMAAAQFYAAAVAQSPDIVTGIEAGDFTPLITWLRYNVHGQGRRHDADGLLQRATGRPLDAAPFKAHLQARYLE